LAAQVSALLDTFGAEIKLLRDPTRGGLATVLNEIARECRLGVNIRHGNLPIDEEVAGACEILGLDPLYVANEGIFVAVCAPEIANQAVELLRAQPHCEKAAIIGEIVDAHAGQVVITSGIGGKRVVNMLIGEQLPRIC